MDSTDPTLFGESDAKDPSSATSPAGGVASPPRLRRADRAQVLLRPCALEDLIDAEHPARMVWEGVSRWI